MQIHHPIPRPSIPPKCTPRPSRTRNSNTTQWALVLAGVSDFWRPAETLSLTQNAALTATGAIWTRWCMIIKPKNVLYVPSPAPYLPPDTTRSRIGH